MNKLLACDCATLLQQSFQLLCQALSWWPIVRGVGRCPEVPGIGFPDTAVEAAIQKNIVGKLKGYSVLEGLAWRASPFSAGSGELGSLVCSQHHKQTLTSKLQHSEISEELMLSHMQSSKDELSFARKPGALLIIQEGILSTWLPESCLQTLPHCLGGWMTL